MGGIFGKNKKSCLFPRVVFRAKSRKAARVCCDVATWTGESHFYSARIGRTPRGFEPPAAKLVLETSGSESGGEEGDSGTSPRAQHSEISVLVVAGPTRGAEPEAKPHPELLQHQELGGEAQGPQNPEDSSEAGAVLHPPGSSLSPELCCGDLKVTPLTQTTVEVDVHVSAGGHGEPGQGQPAAKSELLSAGEQEDGPGMGAEQEDEDEAWGDAEQVDGGWWGAEQEEDEAGRGAEQEEDGAWSSVEQEDGAWSGAEPGEGMENGQGAVPEQGGEESKAPPALQLGQGKGPVPEGVKGAAAEMAEACGDGQTPEEIPACLPETQEEEIQVSSEGKPEQH